MVPVRLDIDRVVEEVGTRRHPQKAAKATRDRSSGTAWVRTPAAPGAANTSTFFDHCLTRAVRIEADKHRRARSWAGRGSLG